MKTQPAQIRGLDGPDQVLKHLKLMDDAASSLSDADLVDGMIHGYDVLDFINVDLTLVAELSNIGP
jgi:hypothetical protein